MPAPNYNNLVVQLLKSKPKTEKTAAAMTGYGSLRDMANENSDDEDEVEVIQKKIVIFGNGAVGKTSLAMKLCNDYFAASYKQTIGCDFFRTTLDVIPDDPQQKPAKV